MIPEWICFRRQTTVTRLDMWCTLECGLVMPIQTSSAYWASKYQCSTWRTWLSTMVGTESMLNSCILFTITTDTMKIKCLGRRAECEKRESGICGLGCSPTSEFVKRILVSTLCYFSGLCRQALLKYKSLDDTSINILAFILFLLLPLFFFSYLISRRDPHFATCHSAKTKRPAPSSPTSNF